MSTQIARIGYLAGREIPIDEIARQTGARPEQVSRILRGAGIAWRAFGGPVVILSVPIEPFVEEIDAIGRRFKMSREQILSAVVASALAEGHERIEDMLERSGHA